MRDQQQPPKPSLPDAATLPPTPAVNPSVRGAEARCLGRLIVARPRDAPLYLRRRRLFLGLRPYCKALADLGKALEPVP
jgi:hypothetical protein